MASATALLAMAYANRALHLEEQQETDSERINSSTNEEKKEKNKNKKQKQLFGWWKICSHKDDNITTKKHDVASDTKAVSS
uniref:Uncharacterized protein n=1 Tax=Picea sitchensis TaxID=3332 RepID=D5A870_PICSI|nr:unknown [Picea sitchensis]